MAGSASRGGRGTSGAAPNHAGLSTPAPTATDRDAKAEMRVDAATAAAQAVGSAVLTHGVGAPVVAPGGETAGPPTAVNLVTPVSGVVQTLTPLEYGLNIWAGSAPAAACVGSAFSSAGAAGAAAAVPHRAPSSTSDGSTIRQPPAPLTRSSRKGKGPASLSGPNFKPPARPPRAATNNVGSSSSAVAILGRRPSTAVATVGDIQLVLAEVRALAEVAHELKGDFTATGGAIDTNGLVVSGVRDAIAAFDTKLDTAINNMVNNSATVGDGNHPAVDTKKAVNEVGFEQMERVRVELRNAIVRQLANATSSEGVYSSSDGYRDSILKAVDEALSLGVEGSQTWLMGVILMPARRKGGQPVSVRPLVPLARVRSHYMQAIKKRATAAWCNAVGENVGTISVVKAGEWRAEAAYHETTVGFKGVVAGVHILFVIIGATGRIKAPTKTGEGVVFEATAGHVALVSVMIRNFLEQAAQMTTDNTIGDALYLHWVAETARTEAHFPADGVRDGLCLLEDK